MKNLPGRPPRTVFRCACHSARRSLLVFGLAAAVTVVAAAHGDTFQPAVSPEEWSCYKARFDREAQALALAHGSPSFVAEFVLADCLKRRGELPEALYHYSQALKILTKAPTHLDRPREGEPQWHTLLLSDFAELQSAMGRLAAEDAILAALGDAAHRPYLDEVPDLDQRRLWNALKSGRIALAHEMATRAVATHPHDHMAKHNLVLVMLEEEPDGLSAYDFYRKFVGDMRTPGAAYLDWLARLAESQCDFPNAEACFRRSIAGASESANVYDAWRALARLETSQSRLTDANESIVASWRLVSGKQHMVRTEMLLRTRRVAAEFSLAAGYPEVAHAMTTILSREESRGGGIMQNVDSWRLGVLAVRWAAMNQMAFCDRPTAAWKTWADREMTRLQMVATLSRIASSGRHFRDLLEMVDVPPWLFGEVFRAIGPVRARELVNSYPFHGPRLQAYSAAFDAEIASLARDWAKAAAAATQALHDLPPQERLLQAKMNVILALAARSAHNPAEYANRVTTARNLNPACFIWMRMPLPMGITADGSPDAESCARILRRPCFEKENAVFGLKIAHTGGSYACVLTGSSGEPVSRFLVPATGTPDQAAVAIQRQLLSALPNLDAQSLSRLQGND